MKTEIDGFLLFPGALDTSAQADLCARIEEILIRAPLFQPTMPRSGKPLSVQMSNAGPLGWISDKHGYRYTPTHPVTGAPWPPIPAAILALWRHYTGVAYDPEACLINRYTQAANARMGLHVDADEAAKDAPILSISLGDAAWFRIGGAKRSDPTRRFKLQSGDIAVLTGPARRAHHGIDRVLYGTSRLVGSGGRINLTLRRVTP